MNDTIIVLSELSATLARIADGIDRIASFLGPAAGAYSPARSAGNGGTQGAAKSKPDRAPPHLSPSGAALSAAQVPTLSGDVSSRPLAGATWPAASPKDQPPVLFVTYRHALFRTPERKAMLADLWEKDVSVLEIMNRLNGLLGEKMTQRQVITWKDELKLRRPDRGKKNATANRP